MSLFKTLLASAGLLLASLAQAEQPLTQQNIEQWLNSIDSIQQWAEGQEALEDNPAEEVNDTFSADMLINQLKAANLYHEAEDIIQKSGFDSAEEWADIQMRIIKSMIALEIEKENVDVDVQAQLDQIRNNPSIPDEQKEMMINMMQSSMKMMESMSNASPADKAAIKPYIEQIRQKLESEEM
ncbi:hypothetical protein [Alkalimarinus sediminis]|uniref:Uncharacterized protein n=1 Tax=Alkalimarinus sediminis TaxID=1632866 RepID=A0A9E8KQG6_9ALTE|nr:hypothetical protein [Alkalimarinus sediminis]UZW75170.1 hypothetical protein NNL22_00765 [Alkalimarinus sediminis]